MPKRETILALDMSTYTGYAVLHRSGTAYSVYKYGNISADDDTNSKYPWTYINKAESMAAKVSTLLTKFKPDVVIIEETNGSKSRYTQKLLEFIHYSVLLKMRAAKANVKYINTSDWRKCLGIQMSKADKKSNTKLSKAKRAASKAKEALDKKKLGISGKITKKHLAVRYINSTFNLDFKIKDNDIAEAICLGVAYIKGVNTNG